MSKPLRGSEKYRPLSAKFFRFTCLLLAWVILVSLYWDITHHSFDWKKMLLLGGTGFIMAGLVSKFTVGLLARPLKLLEEGIRSVGEGRLDPIRVSPTRDEIERLGNNFNRMISALAESHEEIRKHQELLEERIRQRTEELRVAADAATTASKAKSEFLANMSHELRTPMNGLLGMLDLTIETRLTLEQRDQLETAQRCSYSLLALLNDILDLSKIEAGKMMIEAIPFDAKTLVEDCLKAQAAKAIQKGIDVKLDVGSMAGSRMIGDPLRTRQVVNNLLSNAIKFTDKGWVRVKLSSSFRADGKLRTVIAVEDTGTGIPQDKLPTIFEKFTQADNSITRKYGGTGLGLTISRKLVEMQGGVLSVASEVGKGSVFTMDIPFAQAPPEPVEEVKKVEVAAAAATSGSGVRLLLVEDNLVNQKVVLAMLRKKGFQIDVAMNGLEAIEKLEHAAQPYAVVLMDLQMPVMDGLEATRRIRKDTRWDALPIVAMTAHAMTGDKERCLEAGMNAYMSKPIQAPLLISTIERYLSSSVESPLVAA